LAGKYFKAAEHLEKPIPLSSRSKATGNRRRSSLCCLAESCVSTRETVAVKGAEAAMSLKFDCRCVIDEGLSQSLRVFK
jgi:hypothetical protein